MVRKCISLSIFSSFFLSQMLFADSLIEDNSAKSINQTIKTLKSFVQQYPAIDEKWMRNFSYFVTNKIIQSDKQAKIYHLVCSSRPEFYGQCMQGSFSFADTLKGARNVTDILIAHCLPDERLHEKMLMQNMGHLKFILR